MISRSSISVVLSRLLGGMVALVMAVLPVRAAVWQWSVPDGDARAYLWIPDDCARVRGVVVANHNMVEQGILEHETMRATLARLGFAEIWVVPYLDATFDFNQGAGEHFQRVIDALAERSGYAELGRAPVVPLGHSACATFPWNFAAWAPERTLALISYHGDAPRTTLTGNGHERIDWGDRSIAGIPALMVMGQYEWWEDRLTPAFAFQATHLDCPVAFFADVGRGHFDYSDHTVAFLARFIEKAAAARLPSQTAPDGSVVLRPVDPKTGWRIDRWRPDAAPTALAAPYADYKGDPRAAFWCFDEEMARATEALYAGQRGKLPALLSITDGKQPLEAGNGEPVLPRFLPGTDGLTFRLKAAFLPSVPGNSPKGALWTGLPVHAALPMPDDASRITFSRIVGPFVQTGSDTFRLQFGRAEYTDNRRNNDLWVAAAYPGDEHLRGIVQQAMLHVAPNTEGAAQTITFPAIADQVAGVSSLPLGAKSDAGLPVSYYVVEGPAEIDGGTLRFTAIPPRAKFPIKVTVVAWQWGLAGKVKTAAPVERTLFIQSGPRSSTAPAPAVADARLRPVPSIATLPPYQRGPFLHPGGLHTRADLDRMKAKVASRETPWIECWEQLLRDSLAQADYQPAPNANLGVSRQRASRDAHAAYLNFIRGYISGDDRHIDAAIRICNDWSRAVNQVPSGTDIPGLSGIPIAEFAIVGELLRASPRWRPEDFARFQRMVADYFYPVCHSFLSNHNGAAPTNHWANWDIANIGALLSIGVLCDRSDIYDEGVAYYLRGEGMGSIMHAVYKIHPDGLGQWQESGRDQQHGLLGVGMLAQACQIAWNQGLDLYGVADNRLLAGAEYVARTNLNHPVPYAFYTNSQPANNYWLANNALYRIDGRPIWELVYNHYVVRRGLPAPNTAALARLVRPEGGSGDHFGYGTLTFTLDAKASPYPPPPVPLAPADLCAVPGVDRVELSWSAILGDVAQGYEIRRATAAAGPFDVIYRTTTNTSTAHADTGVRTGVCYYYQVAAINQAGTGPYSPLASATPVAAGDLPVGWKQFVIGRAAIVGGAAYARVLGNTVILRGAGEGIGGRSDSFGFAGRKIEGDFTFTARLSDVASGSSGNRVGLMLREGLDSDAKAAFVTLGDLGFRQTRFGVRSEKGVQTSQMNGNDYTWTPVWFRLQRSGDNVTAAHSIDGKTWFEIGRRRLSLAKTGYLGLAATSQDPARPVTATFDHITLDQEP